MRLARGIAVLAVLATLGTDAAAQEMVVPSAAVERVFIPRQAGNAASFQAGTPEEGGKRADGGALPAAIVRPDGQGPFPFVVLLHGSGGLTQPAMRSRWVRPWATLFSAHGIGTAIVDSFAARGVDQVCRSGVAAWAVRRADDAYSARAWLGRQGYADAARIAVMGMSNGGRTVLAFLKERGIGQ